ncbi:MAG: ATPase, T2SS/T4P/T4SS family [Planctomycetota bacterium]
MPLRARHLAETKLPQDGRIALAIDGHAVDLRVATLPRASAEERHPARVLDRSAVSLDLEVLGFDRATSASCAR